MSTLTGKSIVTNGLVLSIDPSNPLSILNSTIIKNIFNPLQGGILTNGTSIVNWEYVFDGINDYIDFGGILNLELQSNITLSFFIKPNTVGTGVLTLFNKRDAVNFIDISIGQSSNSLIPSKVSFSINSSNLTQTSTSLINNNLWQEVTVSFNSTTKELKYYINGVLDSTFTYNNSFAGNASNLVFGGNILNSVNYFNGNMGCIKIYNSVLTQQEITKNFNSQKNRYI